METVNYSEVLNLLRQCRPIVMDAQAVHQVTEKGLVDFVTAVDFHVQEFLSKELAQCWPRIQLLSEEQSQEGLDYTKPCWILDPIDGTSNLMHSFQTSAVSLALWDGEKLVFGAVYNPFREELFHAIVGSGAYLNGEPIHVSDNPDLIHSLVLVGTTPYRKECAGEVFDLLRRIFERCVDIRRCGSAALDLCYVACGRSDAFFEKDLKPWDYAAGMAILQEAGGILTDCTGAVPPAWKRSDCVASNGIVQKEFMSIING